MRLDFYKDSRDTLLKQENMKEIHNILASYEHGSYFHIYSDKYFTKNQRKDNNKENYDNYFSAIKSKDEAYSIINDFETRYDSMTESSKKNKIFDYEVEYLENDIAKLEIVISKIISLNTLPLKVDNEYASSKDEIFELVTKRDSLVEKIEIIRYETVENRKTMSD